MAVFHGQSLSASEAFESRREATLLPARKRTDETL